MNPVPEFSQRAHSRWPSETWFTRMPLATSSAGFPAGLALSRPTWARGLVGAAAVTLLLVSFGCEARPSAEAGGSALEVSVTSALQSDERGLPHGTGSEGALGKDLYEITIGVPPPLRGVTAEDLVNVHGATKVQCSTCHSIRSSNFENARSDQLDEFHQGLKMAHGNLTCVSCHNTADNYASLKLADGRTVAFEDSMQLCAQCHGPQYRDYQHGAHGGMSGFWDLSRGPRYRNHCQHCHDPHAPAFPQFAPVAGPRDRFPPLGTHDSSAPHQGLKQQTDLRQKHD